ncbi:hypothetical protein OH77DRAFT_856491 [Trametes cingulata]|nr:hypothetical protein OH77DRAFT_856491 [Trametes cingulata]
MPTHQTNMSEESLPVYSQASDEQPRATPLMRAQQLFLVLGGPAAPQYVRVPTSGSEEDLEKGLLSTVEVSGVESPPDSPTSATAEAQVPPVAPRLTGRALCKALASVFWFIRVAMYLALWGAGAALLAGAIGYLLSMVTLFGHIAPFKEFPIDKAFTAVAVGAPILGGAAGLVAFLVMCVRWAGMTVHQREKYVQIATRRIPGELVADLDDSYDPSWKEWTCTVVAAVLLSPLGFALGMAVAPGFVAIGQEVGFTVGHAVAVGFWGICIPFVPSFISAIFSTLLSCDPAGGFWAGCGFWAAFAGVRDHY